MDQWSEVYERYGPVVWVTVFRVLGNYAEALDCCQDVFAELLQSGDAREVRDWVAFLRWLATCRALDRLRRRRAELSQVDARADVACVPAISSSPSARADFTELTGRLKRELGRLPAKQAEAFWLLSVEQMNYQEIAGQMGIETNQVGVLVHRARQRLRNWLADLRPQAQETECNSKAE